MTGFEQRTFGDGSNRSATVPQALPPLKVIKFYCKVSSYSYQHKAAPMLTVLPRFYSTGHK